MRAEGRRPTARLAGDRGKGLRSQGNGGQTGAVADFQSCQTSIINYYWLCLVMRPGHTLEHVQSQLILKLNTEQPIELSDFVGAFTSIANEFERFIQRHFSGASANPQIYVREIRNGCVEADLITGLVTLSAVTIAHMDQIQVLEDFVRRWGRRVSALIKNDVPEGELDTINELNDFLDATKSIASDPLASHRLEAAVFEDGRKQIRAAFQFSAVDARAAQQHIEDRKKSITLMQAVPHLRVLMIYTRTDIHDARINKKSGERVRVPQISERDYSVIYASELVEQEIRQQIRDADENVYKKGFVVDIVVHSVNDNVAAYSVTAFHTVIDVD